MKFVTCDTIEKRPKTDLLILPFGISKGKIHPLEEFASLKKIYTAPIEAQDFQAKEGEVSILYPENEKETRLLLLGVGDTESLTTEKLRRFYAIAMKSAWKYKAKSIAVILPKVPALSLEFVSRGILEGLLLANYSFDMLKSENKEAAKPVEKIVLVNSSKHVLEMAHKTETIAEGVYLARDLVNGNADDINPSYLVKLAEDFPKHAKNLKTKVLDKAQLEKGKFGLLLAVGRAAVHPPALIIIEYSGAPKSKETTILVGKGVTFDTGGLNLKGTGNMETMKSDMGGAAAVLATILTAARLGIKQNITAVVPTVENAVDAKSYKPGDVYKSYLGKSVEISNTDAEGRLILADALSYAAKNLNPTRIIDLATLTGAMEISLGQETTGFFSNQDALADRLLRASSETFERLWRLPLFDEYKEPLRSEIADLRNHGGRAAGAIIAAKFLEEFVDKKPWAHLDIAGTAYLSEARRYNPRFGTGCGVRLLIEFLEQL